MNSCSGNPYLEAFNKLRGEARWAQRMDLVRRYAWAIPNDAAIRRLVSLSPVIEIGAGAGYWACLVKQAGGKIVAYDPNPPGSDNQYLADDVEAYFPVKQGGLEGLAVHRARTLFICWPPMTDWAYKTLLAFKGERFVYVGEDSGGCTGDASFFALLGALSRYDVEDNPEASKIKPQWERVGAVDIPQWSGIHDEMTIYKRR